jgi:hypothetical protein
MNPESSSYSEARIAVAMTIAERNGYPTNAWRLFEAEAEAALKDTSKHQAPRRPDLAAS